MIYREASCAINWLLLSPTVIKYVHDMASQTDYNMTSGTPYILLVDDNKMELELNSLTLEEVDPNLKKRFFESATDVLAFLRSKDREAGNPAFMLLDLKMPVMDGFELLDIMQKEQLKNFPVIVLSSSILNEDQIRAKQLGADEYRTKPINYLGNLELFKSLIDKYIPTLHNQEKNVLPGLLQASAPGAVRKLH